MSLPPLACWESKVAGQEYQICWLPQKAQKHKEKVQSSSFSLLAYNRDRTLKAEL
jgi:hypothetical protein